MRVAPVPIDAGQILHATKSLSSEPELPAPFEIFTLPEETEEEWQAILAAALGPVEHSTNGRASLTPLADVPGRSHTRIHTRTRREFKKKESGQSEAAEGPSSSADAAKESNVQKQKPVIL